jgi:tripartite-type tricarboxylate transporter receptor subunit TctC
MIREITRGPPMKSLVRSVVTAVTIGCSAGVGTIGWAQSGAEPESSYPSRPIRLIVQFPAGTGTDIMGRLIGQKLTEAWGRQVIIDNRPGAGGRIGTELGAKATPDGYTLTMGVGGATGIAPAVYPKLPYDVLRDFAPVTNMATWGMVLLASPSIPAKTLADVVELARSRPDALNYGSVGAGTISHLSMEMLKSRAKVKITNIPFKGSAEAQSDLASGRLQLMVDSLAASLPFIQAGKVRGIAVTSLDRQRFAPELPTIAESGYPGFEVLAWGGVLAPAKTPAPILDKLNRELVRIAKLPETQERFNSLGYNPAPGTRAQYTAFIRSEIEKWRKVVKEAGIKLED